MPKIYVAGHKGMVGSAIVRGLVSAGNNNIITRSHNDLNLINQAEVNKFFSEEKPNQVYIAAAKVGGIYANNNYPAEFIYQNLMIQANIIEAAYLNNVDRLLFLGSSCIYPKSVQQPMPEEALLTGILESTNEPYAIAKIAGIKLCESYNRQYGCDFRSLMPTNLFGPGDNYHPENSHVIPALIRRFHEAKIKNSPTVSIWGSGSPLREFLFVDDMASASIFVMNLDRKIYNQYTKPMLSHINVGSGVEVTISEIAKIIGKIVGFDGEITFDNTKPDGIPRKLLDSSRLKKLGWKPQMQIELGLQIAYEDFLMNHYKQN